MYKTVYYVKSLQTKRALLRFIEKIGATLVQKIKLYQKKFDKAVKYGII